MRASRKRGEVGIGRDGYRSVSNAQTRTRPTKKRVRIGGRVCCVPILGLTSLLLRKILVQSESWGGRCEAWAGKVRCNTLRCWLWQSSQHQSDVGEARSHCIALSHTHRPTRLRCGEGRGGLALTPSLTVERSTLHLRPAAELCLARVRLSSPCSPASATTILTLAFSSISTHTHTSYPTGSTRPPLVKNNENLLYPPGACRPVQLLQCFYAQGAHAQGRCRPRRRPR